MTRRVWIIAFSLAILAAPAGAQTAKHHMIVAAEPMAAEAGLKMLRAGGSAVDAAIAAQLVLTLVEPQSAGIGGGAYMLVADADGKLAGYDGREIAPASAKPTMFLDAKGIPREWSDVVPGGLSVGVPGDVAMLAKAYAAHGHLAWAKLFQPAIHLAEKGFKVPARLAAELREYNVAAMPTMKQSIFFHTDGTPVAAGETLTDPAYAETLREIAKGGADAFYNGQIADEIADAVGHAPTNPAVMTRADFASYHAVARVPLCEPYRGFRVCGMPPSSSGGVTVLQILGLIERFNSAQLKPGTLSGVHLVTQAERLAYADRARWLGDTDFVPSPVAALLDRNYLAERSLLISSSRDTGRALAGTPPVQPVPDLVTEPAFSPPGTSHLSVVDDSGEAVSLTMSIEAPFGAGLMAGGFMLNNELTDFAFVPEIAGHPVANAPHAGKRPLSSMSPMIVFGPDGKFFAAIGSPGGSFIISYVAEALVALVDASAPMREAVSLPHYLNMNGATLLEKGTALQGLAPQLAQMGHPIRFTALESGLNGIRRVAGGYEGAADPRREGAALGD